MDSKLGPSTHRAAVHMLTSIWPHALMLVPAFAALCRGRTVCSYTCTPDGVRELTTMTGTTDRWAEAIIEGSYGRLSLLPDPVVLPTLYLPKEPPAGSNAFSYNSSLVQAHL